MLTRIVFFLASQLVFSTRWQEKYRTLGFPGIEKKSVLIENAYTHHLEKISDGVVAPKIFLWAGRDIPLKNVERLKAAFTEAQKHVPHISLLLLSRVTHEVVLRHMRNAYALILPSYSEDSPNLILEGLSFGKPFIATMHNGLHDLIAPFGIFVDPCDQQAITDAIIKMCDVGTHRSFEAEIKKFHYMRTYDDIAKEFIQLITLPE